MGIEYCPDTTLPRRTRKMDCSIGGFRVSPLSPQAYKRDVTVYLCPEADLALRPTTHVHLPFATPPGREPRQANAKSKGSYTHVSAPSAAANAVAEGTQGSSRGSFRLRFSYHLLGREIRSSAPSPASVSTYNEPSGAFNITDALTAVAQQPLLANHLVVPLQLEPNELHVEQARDK